MLCIPSTESWRTESAPYYIGGGDPDQVRRRHGRWSDIEDGDSSNSNSSSGGNDNSDTEDAADAEVSELEIPELPLQDLSDLDQLCRQMGSLTPRSREQQRERRMTATETLTAELAAMPATLPRKTFRTRLGDGLKTLWGSTAGGAIKKRRTRRASEIKAARPRSPRARWPALRRTASDRGRSSVTSGIRHKNVGAHSTATASPPAVRRLTPRGQSSRHGHKLSL